MLQYEAQLNEVTEKQHFNHRAKEAVINSSINTQDSKSNRWGRAVAQSKYLTIISVTRTCTFNPSPEMKTMAGLCFLNPFYLLLKSESVLCDCLQAHFNICDLSRRWPSPTTTHTSLITPDGNYTCAQAAQCHFTNKSQSSVHPLFITIEKKEFKQSLLHVTQKWEWDEDDKMLHLLT